MTGESDRPVPQPTLLSRPFWDACREERLTVQRCENCHEYIFIPRTFCPVCLSTSLAWTDATGLGTIVTYTVVWRAQTPAFATPYVVAVVRLDEGYEMLTNIVDSEPEDVSIGARVQIRFVEISADVTLPCFTVAA